jgi:hypothetical protein
MGTKLDYKKEFKLKFGEKALFRVPYSERGSKTERAEIGTVVGKIVNSLGIYKVYVPERNKVVKRYYYKKLGKDSILEKEQKPVENEILEEEESELYWTDPDKDNKEKIFHLSVKKSLIQYGEAAEKAIHEELSQMIEKKVWEPVNYDELDGSVKKNVIESLMFVKMKQTADMKDDRLKARMCADPTRKYNGYGRSFYSDTNKNDEYYAPTVNLQTLMTVLGVASYKGMKYRMTKDVTGAFLIADMVGKDVHMVIGPEISKILVKYYDGYKKFLRNDGAIVVRLNKALYGLQEAPATWNKHLKDSLEAMGAVHFRANNEF